MRRAVIAVIAVAAIVVAAVLMVDTFTRPDNEPVVVLGDSITAIGRQQLIATAGDEFHLDVRAAFGAQIASQLDAARAAAALKPTQVIINLGTNDTLHGVATADSIAALEQMVSMFRSARCIHFVTINPHLDQDGNRPRVAIDALNDEMLRLANRLGRGDVIRWDRLSDDATTRHEPLGLTDDGVHPSPRGQRELADAEVGALLRCGRPWHIW